LKVITWLKVKLAQLYSKEEGQTIVEYALIIVLIALAVLLASPSLTQAIIKVFTDTSSLLGYRP
jgi:Flp pilus assembly pilin Flp